MLIADNTLKSIAGGAQSTRTCLINQIWWGALSVIYMFAGITLAFLWLAMTPDFSIQAFLGVGVLVLFGAGSATYLSYISDYCGQNRRDLQAAKLDHALAAGEKATPYVLYLRPFASTDQFSEVAESGPMVARMADAAGASAPTTERFELEHQIQRCTKSIGPLVALGQPLEHLGAGRILTTDANWKTVALRLMLQAELIILLPSSREGTLWEIDTILTRDMIRRTIIIDPPNLERQRAAKRYDHAVEWADIQEAFQRHGYALPDETAKGALLSFTSGRRDPDIAPFRMSDARAVRQFLARSIRNLKRQQAS